MTDIVGTENDDTLIGTADADTIEGLAGRDTIDGSAGDDLVRGGADFDFLYGGVGADRLESGDGGGWLYGEAGDDTLVGGADAEYIYDGAGDDSVFGGGGDDYLWSRGYYKNGGYFVSSGSDSLNGQAGNDVLSIWRNYDDRGERISATGGIGDDRIEVSTWGFSSTYALYGNAGADHIELFSYYSNTFVIDAGEDDDVVFIDTAGGPVSLTLGAGADIVRIGQRQAEHAGLALTVTDFQAGAGGDRLAFDSYIAAALVDWDQSSNPFGSGHLQLVQSGADTLLQIDRDGSSGTAHGLVTLITFRNVDAIGFTSENLGGYPADGSPAPGRTIAGTELADNLVGTVGGDTIDGLGGNDVVHAGAGDDLVRGGAGFDSLYGGVGADRIESGDGGGWVYGEAGNDTLIGGADRDEIYDGAGDDSVSGGGGDDFLSSRTYYADGGYYEGSGSDSLNGQAGDDVIYVVRNYGHNGERISATGGFGNDRIEIEAWGDSSTFTLYGNTGADYVRINSYYSNRFTINTGEDDDLVFIERLGGAGTVSLGAGSDIVRIGPLQAELAGASLTVTDFETGAAGDSVDFDAFIATALVNWDQSSNPFGSGYLQLVQSGTGTLLQIDRDGSHTDYGMVTLITFANVDATSFTAENFDGYPPDGSTPLGQTITGTELADELIGTIGADSIDGLEGDDVIDAGAGDDLVIGGSGFDTLYGGAGHDRLEAGQGGGRLYGEGGDDRLVGSADREELFDGAGNDMIVAGGGDDYISSSYYFENGHYYQSSGSDVLNGQAGDDIIEISRYSQDREERISVYGGFGDDTVRVQTWADSSTFTIYGNSGADRVSIDSYYGNRFVVDTGDNDDLVFIDRLGGSATLTLGSGADAIRLGQAQSDHASPTLLITDFETGAAGDRLYSADFLAVATNWDQSSNPFASGYLQLVQNGADTLLQIDRDGAGGTGYGFATLVTFRNVDAVTFTPDNLDGYYGFGTLREGTSGAELIEGGAASDTLLGLDGADRLAGGGGQDLLVGGAGADVYLFGAATDSTAAAPDLIRGFESGVDTIDLRGALAASARLVEAGDFTDIVVETLTGPMTIRVDGAVVASDLILAPNVFVGTAGSDLLYGGSSDDYLDGREGADRMEGRSGNDRYFIDDAGDVVVELAGQGNDRVAASVSHTLGAHVEQLELTGTDAVDGTGNALANLIVGNIAANLLDGLSGADRMSGGGGDDLYMVDDAGDRAIEEEGAGTDTVHSSVTFALGANVENLVLTGRSPINGGGNALDNEITGNGAANRLNGGGGADRLIGGDGHDTYIVDHVSDAAVEISATGGTDTVRSSVSFTLGAYVENLVLTGTDPLDGTGNELANRIDGNAGANRLDGGTGADRLVGGLGDDIYLVDDALDKAIETSSSGGTDTVRSAVNFALAANVENLVLTGTGGVNGTGNALANAIDGNGGANLLNGGAGADTLTGGDGNDIYIVDNLADLAIETSAAGGTDTVRSAVAFALGEHLEDLVLTGTRAIAGTGNALDNRIYGNGAANRLDGSAGADVMNGGLGDDIYVVDDVADRAIETSAGGGTDTVQSAVDFTLGNNVENMLLIGSAAVNGTGNALANTITGNTAANVLKGADGDDAISAGQGDDDLHGGLGLDTLTGGGGYDDFYFDAVLGPDNADIVTDFTRGADRLLLDDAVFAGLAPGALAADALVLGTAATTADHRIVYDAASGALFFDADGSGAGAAIQFATLANLPASLSVSDFLVI